MQDKNQELPIYKGAMTQGQGLKARNGILHLFEKALLFTPTPLNLTNRSKEEIFIKLNQVTEVKFQGLILEIHTTDGNSVVFRMPPFKKKAWKTKIEQQLSARPDFIIKVLSDVENIKAQSEKIKNEVIQIENDIEDFKKAYAKIESPQAFVTETFNDNISVRESKIAIFNTVIELNAKRLRQLDDATKELELLENLHKSNQKADLVANDIEQSFSDFEIDFSYATSIGYLLDELGANKDDYNTGQILETITHLIETKQETQDTLNDELSEKQRNFKELNAAEDLKSLEENVQAFIKKVEGK